MGRFIALIGSVILLLLGLAWMTCATGYVLMFWNFGPDPRVYTPLQNVLYIAIAIVVWAVLPGGLLLGGSVALYRTNVNSS
jgi:hypothetical protein